MRSLRTTSFRVGLVLLLALLSAAPGRAQVGGPPTPPVTLWNFLGIPQGIRKLQGATRNRRGNHPNREPKPPLKAIADPANLESENKAIKKAAEVKQQEDLKKQKIKAVKYLASIGCGCYDKIDGGVTAALVDAMGDCTEDVRYETIKAISEAAENGCCSNCGSSCCCNKDILTAMAKLAYERDEHGCYVEPSERVREAAVEALRTCCPNDSPPVIVEPEQPQQPVRESAEEIEEGPARETAPGDEIEPLPPTPPTPPAGDPATATFQAPEAPRGVSTPLNSAVGDVSAPAGFGFGVIIDVSAPHNLAHVHFNKEEVLSAVGSEVGVYQQSGGERRLIARLQVVESFPGSAIVTGTPEALASIVRGDLVLRREINESAAEPVVASAPIEEPVEPTETAWIEPLPPVEVQAMMESPAPAPVEQVEIASTPAAAPAATPAPAAVQAQTPVVAAEPIQRPAAPARTNATAQVTASAPPAAVAQPAVRQASAVRPATPAERSTVRPAVARRPMTAVFMP